MSYVWSIEPLVTPRGKPTNEGVVVATPALAGGTAQQWMCEAVVPDVSPENVVATRNVCAAALIVTVVEPVPEDATGGFSFEPESVAV
jgi:hypothetical protein